jgi:hypothetical protein
MMVPLLLQVVGVALITSGLALFPAGFLLLGKSDAKSTGVVTLVSGLSTLILAFIITIVLSAPLIGGLGFVFGIAQTATGYHLYRGLDLKGIGWYCVVAAYITAFYAALWSIQHSLWYAGFAITWTVLFALFVPTTLKPTPLLTKITAIYVIIDVIATLITPGVILAMGIYAFA